MESPEWQVATYSSVANAIQSVSLLLAPTVLTPLLATSISIQWVPMPAAVVRLTVAALLIPVSWVAEKLGTVRSIRLGVLGMALTAALAGLGSFNSVGSLGMVHVILAAFGTLSWLPVYTVLVFAWMYTNSGSILGLGASSFELCAVIGVPLWAVLGATFGWGGAMLGVAALMLLVAAPLSVAFLEEPQRNSAAFSEQTSTITEVDVILKNEAAQSPGPDSARSRTGGANGTIADDASDSAETVVYVGDYPDDVDPLGSLHFRLLAVAAFLSHFGFGALQENLLVFLMHDRGWQMSGACILLAVFLSTAGATKLGLGYTSDRFDHRWRTWITSRLSLIGALAALLLHMFSQLTIIFMPFTLMCAAGAFGASTICRHFMISEFFESGLGTVQSTLFAGELVGHAAGAMLAACIRWETSSYPVAFGAGLLAMAFASYATESLLHVDDAPASYEEREPLMDTPTPERKPLRKESKDSSFGRRMFSMSTDFARGGLKGVSRNGSFMVSSRKHSSSMTASDYKALEEARV
eukprot:CAMPEP_0198311674 /NCGR_PEP_ID=MMETSP1450-20131203/3325_1 /TAXON_ID=753684 ORGANISM="Madagascaria erythrocladiodes, Strain CCMP3234" /NCGR_SAMPLE_ID=MMETSP1450 /ASSEMBLY_ACC=CAM_ASM_001115 /LENGTH=524 /DNA_ID=CAMNT_0044014577 /DNA_START=104 /DNA_END=1678 /DNA_ORIENTATION=+